MPPKKELSADSDAPLIRWMRALARDSVTLRFLVALFAVEPPGTLNF